MDSDTIHKLVIIGSGPAGLTAAIYAARAHLEPVIIEGKMPGGQLMRTNTVENWPGYISITGPELMQNLRNHAQYFGTRFVSGDVTKVNFSNIVLKLWTSRDNQLNARSIIIATGASPIKLKCPGEEEYWAKGVSTCAICDGFFYKDKHVLIVGGGNTAMEQALFLQKYTPYITIIQLKNQLTANPSLVERVLKNPELKILYQSTVSAIHGDGTRVTHVTITNIKDNQPYDITIDGLFIAIGLTPNTQLFKDYIEINEQGYITLSNNTQTSKPGIFAAGDVFDNHYRQAITASGSGCMAALDAERYLSATNNLM